MEPRPGDRLPLGPASFSNPVVGSQAWTPRVGSCPVSPGSASALGIASSQSRAQRLRPWLLLGPWPCQVCPACSWGSFCPGPATTAGLDTAWLVAVQLCPWLSEPPTCALCPLCMAPASQHLTPHHGSWPRCHLPCFGPSQGRWRLPLLSYLWVMHALDWSPDPQTLCEGGTGGVAGLSRNGDRQ